MLFRSCDAHSHIYDARFAVSGPTARMVQQGSVADYRQLQTRLGTSRAVVVTPAPYRFDNRVTLDAIAQLGVGNARGVAVIAPDMSDAELAGLHAGGVRGIRFTLFDPNTAVTRLEWIEPLATRVRALGWHVQIHMRGDQIVEHAALLERVAATMVFDHMGRLPRGATPDHAALSIVARFLEQGRAWVKLSGAYLDSDAPYDDRAAIARTYIKIAPERVVWGSDWPHPTEVHKPDDTLLFDLLHEWAGSSANMRKILVDNPAKLYGFTA